MNLLLSQVLKASPDLTIDIQQIFLRVGHAFSLGVLLMLATYLISIQHRRSRPSKPGQTTVQLTTLSLLGLSNLLFLCLGLTGIMLLINNNIVRAFSIVAAIALVRFRIKVDQNNLNASYLFAVLAGMASGLGEVHIAWILTAVYCLILIGLTAALNLISRMAKESSSTLSLVAAPPQEKLEAQPKTVLNPLPPVTAVGLSLRLPQSGLRIKTPTQKQELRSSRGAPASSR